MMASSFVFFYVGQNISIPQMLVDSIRWSNPGATVVQCSDASTPTVFGVDRKTISACDPTRLMTSRLYAFASAGVDHTAVYVDADMLIVKPLDLPKILGNSRIAVTRRSFKRKGLFNPVQRGINFYEYANRTIDEVYPYVACFTIAKDSTPWSAMLDILFRKAVKFHKWYGDQEAIKEYVTKNPGACLEVQESIYGCTPDQLKNFPEASVIHFKGSHKALMTDTYFQLRAARQRSSDRADPDVKSSDNLCDL